MIEDTKGVTRSRESRKDRKNNGQNNTDKMTHKSTPHYT